MIFDTSVVLKILKERNFLKAVESKIDDEVKVTSVSVYELLRGTTYIRLIYHSEKELNVILSLISEVKILPMENEDAKIAAYIWAKLREKGITISDADILIASICIRNNEKLLTLDTDFEKIKEVYDDFEVEVLG